MNVCAPSCHHRAPPLGGAETPAASAPSSSSTLPLTDMNPAPLSSLEHLKSISPTARRQLPKTRVRPVPGGRIVKDNPERVMPESRNSEGRSGAVSSCWGALEGWREVASQSLRTSNFYRLSSPPSLQVSSSTPTRTPTPWSRLVFTQGSVRLESSDRTPSVCRWCVVGGVLKRRGNGISGFCGWQWRINERRDVSGD